jgi:hypothetical protein
MPHKFSKDRTGLPIIWVPSIGAYVNFFPITKVSFEYFLCDRVAAQAFDATWYSKILQQNPREAVGEIRNENVERAFVTGVTPDEIAKFHRWLGANKFNCRLPSNEEWTEIYRFASSQSVLPIESLPIENDKTGRLEELVRNLLQSSTPQIASVGLFVGAGVRNPTTTNTLASQMFLQNGIGEWVTTVNNGKPGIGARGGIMRRLNGDGMDPLHPRILFVDRADSRPKEVGFRLVMQERL